MPALEDPVVRTQEVLSWEEGVTAVCGHTQGTSLVDSKVNKPAGQTCPQIMFFEFMQFKKT